MDDGGRPSEDGLQDQFSNHPTRLGDEIPGREQIGTSREGNPAGEDQEGERK